MTYNKLNITQFEITEKEYQEYINSIKRGYINAYKDTKQLLSNTYAKMSDVDSENYYTYMTQRNRLEKLLKDIGKNYKEATKNTFANLKAGGTLNVANMYYRNKYVIEWSGQLIKANLRKELIDVVVTGSTKVWQDIKNKQLYTKILPKYGTLSDLINKNATEELNRIRQTLTNSLINGQSFTKTARQLREVYNFGANNALRVARTEGIRNLNAGAYLQQVDAEQQGIEMFKMWDATLDTRTRETHGSADRQKRQIDENYNVGSAVGLFPGQMSEVKENVNCRCASVSLPDELEPETRRARNPVKEIQWRNASAAEKRNRMLKDGTRIYSRSEQTDVIQNRSFNEWMELNNLKYNKSGVIVLK